ncbi:MAG TPA: hypothetical protein PKZ92_02210 [Candidatus Woesebacteria bacterium]|jgi:hypothetical protein|nr:hypothetical protein [Candidatus Shapirobacteria bacterium]HOR02049.1 hypothetical protein [Candidatus Woesebacteria bacterium]
MVVKKNKTKWIIKTIGEVSHEVSEGEKVTVGKLLAWVKPKVVESFSLAQFFGKLSTEKLEQLNQNFKNSWVNSGDLLCLTGGLFPKKICFPMSGNFLEIDEFGNLKIERVEDEEKEIKAPVKSKVSKIEPEKIVLDFEAIEVSGEGIIEGKAWGNGEIKIIDDIRELKSSLKGEVLFSHNIDRPFLLKAEVVGVTAIVTDTEVKSGEIDLGLPMLKLTKETWKEVMRYKGKQASVLVNSRVGRLLIVLE